MSLFKKNLVLSGKGKLAYATIVKVGSSVGIKISAPVDGGLTAVKLGSEEYVLPCEAEASLETGDFSPEEVVIYVVKDREVILSTTKKDDGLLKRALEYRVDEAAKPVEVVEAVPIDADEELKVIKNKPKENFYIGIMDKIEEMMTIYPADEELDDLLEGGNFVKIPYDETDYYSVGTLTSNGKVVYVVYAIKGKSGIAPPKETAEAAQFLPTDNGNGYWVIMQDASSGDIVKND